MVLNIFPRREKTVVAPAPALESTLPEPSVEALEDRKRPTRRGSRGGRGRGKAAVAEVAPDGAVAPQDTTEAPPRVPARRTRTRPAVSQELEVAVPEAPSETVPEPAVPAARSRRAPRQPATSGAEEVPTRAPVEATTAGILKAIEQQSRQIDQLMRMQEEAGRRGGGSGGAASAPPARVGVFVDAANVELASDRLRARFDWKKILDMLTRDRQLVRAIAYSPVHDDPGVSIETQRFVEPFLGKGYKVVTKPLKRFADGSIKANVDIEMALDVIEMADRLDVVCLISGDGDFQRLVEVVQSKGVRVEVVAVGSSTASNLRNAADYYIDLQTRLKDVKV
jgi:uncharacterized LabA/DUF88 family protein